MVRSEHPHATSCRCIQTMPQHLWLRQAMKNLVTDYVKMVGVLYVLYIGCFLFWLLTSFQNKFYFNHHSSSSHPCLRLPRNSTSKALEDNNVTTVFSQREVYVQLTLNTEVSIVRTEDLLIITKKSVIKDISIPSILKYGKLCCINEDNEFILSTVKIFSNDSSISTAYELYTKYIPGLVNIKSLINLTFSESYSWLLKYIQLHFSMATKKSDAFFNFPGADAARLLSLTSESYKKLHPHKQTLTVPAGNRKHQTNSIPLRPLVSHNVHTLRRKGKKQLGKHQYISSVQNYHPLKSHVHHFKRKKLPPSRFSNYVQYLHPNGSKLLPHIRPPSSKDTILQRRIKLPSRNYLAPITESSKVFIPIEYPVIVPIYAATPMDFFNSFYNNPMNSPLTSHKLSQQQSPQYLPTHNPLSTLHPPQQESFQYLSSNPFLTQNSMQQHMFPYFALNSPISTQNPSQQQLLLLQNVPNLSGVTENSNPRREMHFQDQAFIQNSQQNVKQRQNPEGSVLSVLSSTNKSNAEFFQNSQQVTEQNLKSTQNPSQQQLLQNVSNLSGISEISDSKPEMQFQVQTFIQNSQQNIKQRQNPEGSVLNSTNKPNAESFQNSQQVTEQNLKLTQNPSQQQQQLLPNVSNLSGVTENSDRKPEMQFQDRAFIQNYQQNIKQRQNPEGSVLSSTNKPNAEFFQNSQQVTEQKFNLISHPNLQLPYTYLKQGKEQKNYIYSPKIPALYYNNTKDSMITMPYFLPPVSVFHSLQVNSTPEQHFKVRRKNSSALKSRTKEDHSSSSKVKLASLAHFPSQKQKKNYETHQNQTKQNDVDLLSKNPHMSSQSTTYKSFNSTQSTTTTTTTTTAPPKKFRRQHISNMQFHAPYPYPYFKHAHKTEKNKQKRNRVKNKKSRLQNNSHKYYYPNLMSFIEEQNHLLPSEHALFPSKYTFQEDSNFQLSQVNFQKTTFQGINLSSEVYPDFQKSFQSFEQLQKQFTNDQIPLLEDEQTLNTTSYFQNEKLSQTENSFAEMPSHYTQYEPYYKNKLFTNSVPLAVWQKDDILSKKYQLGIKPYEVLKAKWNFHDVQPETFISSLNLSTTKYFEDAINMSHFSLSSLEDQYYYTLPLYKENNQESFTVTYTPSFYSWEVSESDISGFAQLTEAPSVVMSQAGKTANETVTPALIPELEPAQVPEPSQVPRPASKSAIIQLQAQTLAAKKNITLKEKSATYIPISSWPTEITTKISTSFHLRTKFLHTGMQKCSGTFTHSPTTYTVSLGTAVTESAEKSTKQQVSLTYIPISSWPTEITTKISTSFQLGTKFLHTGMQECSGTFTHSPTTYTVSLGTAVTESAEKSTKQQASLSYMELQNLLSRSKCTEKPTSKQTTCSITTTTTTKTTAAATTTKPSTAATTTTMTTTTTAKPSTSTAAAAAATTTTTTNTTTTSRNKTSSPLTTIATNRETTAGPEAAEAVATPPTIATCASVPSTCSSVTSTRAMVTTSTCASVTTTSTCASVSTTSTCASVTKTSSASVTTASKCASVTTCIATERSTTSLKVLTMDNITEEGESDEEDFWVTDPPSSQSNRQTLKMKPVSRQNPFTRKGFSKTKCITRLTTEYSEDGETTMEDKIYDDFDGSAIVQDQLPDDEFTPRSMLRRRSVGERSTTYRTADDLQLQVPSTSSSKKQTQEYSSANTNLQGVKKIKAREVSEEHWTATPYRCTRRRRQLAKELTTDDFKEETTSGVTLIKKDPTCISRLLDTSEEEEVEDVVFKHFPTRRRKIKPTRRTTLHKLHPSTTLLPFCEYDDYDDEDDSNANIRILVMADNPATRQQLTSPKEPATKEIPEICKTKSTSTFGKEVSLLRTNLSSTAKEYSTMQITYQSNPNKGYKRSTLNESSTPRSTELASKHSIPVLKISSHDNHTLYNKSSATTVRVSRKKLSKSPTIKIANEKTSYSQSKVTTCSTKPISSPPTKALKSSEAHEFYNKSSKQHSTATTVYLASPKTLPLVTVHRLGKAQGIYNKSSTGYSKKTTACLSSQHILSQIKLSTVQTGQVSQIRPSRRRPLMTSKIPTSTSANILTLQSNHTSAKILTLQSNHTSAKILMLQSNHTSAKFLKLQSNQTKQVETHTEHFTESVTNPYVSTIIPLLFQGDKMKQVKTSTESSTVTETNNKFSPLKMALKLQSNQMERMKSNTECLIYITTKNPLSSLNQVEQATSSTECSTMPPINSLISLLKMLALTANTIEEMKSSTECSSGTRVCLTAPYLSSPMNGRTTLTMKDKLKKYKQPLKGAYATTETLEWDSAFRIFASLIKKVQLEEMEALTIQTQSPPRANSKLNGSSSQMPFGETTRKVQPGETKLVSQHSPAARTNFLTGHSPKTSTTNTKYKLPNMNIYSSPGLHSHRTTTFLENNSTLLENNSTFSVKLPTQSIQKSFSGKDKYSGIEQHSNATRPYSMRSGLPQTERSSTTRKRYSIIEKILHKKARSVLAMIKEYPVKHRFKRSVDNIKKVPSEKSTKTKLLALDFTKQIPEMREDITLPTLRPLPLEVTEDFSNDLEYDRDPVLDFDTENSDDLLDEMEMITPEEETKFTPKSRLPVSRYFEVESETIPIRHNTMESSWPVSQPPQATPTQIACRLKVDVSSNVHHINKGNHQLKEKFDECLRSVPDRCRHTHAMIVPSDLLVPYAVTYPEEMSENLKISPYKAFYMNTIYPVEPTQVNSQPALDTKLNMFPLVNYMVKNALENKAAETPETVVMVITVKNENNATDSVITPASEVIPNISEDVRYHKTFESYHPEVINKEKNAIVIKNPETFVTSTPEVSMNFAGLSSPVHYTFTTSESTVEVPNNLPYLNSSLHNTLIIIGPEAARNLAYLNIPLNNTSITSDREITQDMSDLNNTFSSTYRKYSEPARDLFGLKMLHFNALFTSAPELVAEMSDLKHPFHKVSMISVPEVTKNFSDLKSSFQKISLMSAPKIANNFSYFWRPFQNISIAPVQEVGKKLYGSVGPSLTTATTALPSLRNLESPNVNLMNISKVMLAPQPEMHMAFFPFAIQNSELNGSKNSILSAADHNLMTSSIAKEYKCNFTTKAKSTASVHTSQQTKSTATSVTLTTRKISLMNVPYFKGEDEEDNVNDYTVYTHSPAHTKTTAKSKTQKTSHYKTQTSSIVSSTTTSQHTSVNSSIGKFHIRTTLLYPNQSAMSTTVTGRKESKRSMTTASEPTGNILKCISIESVIQNKSMQISTPSTPTKSTEKTYSAAPINTTYVASSSIVVPPKSLSEGLMKDMAVKPSSRPSILVSRSVSEVNCSEVSTVGAQDSASIQIMLPKSLITDWLIQNKTRESPQCRYSNVSTDSTQTLSSAPVVLIQNKTVGISPALPKPAPECYTSAPPSSNVTHHLINIPHGTFISPQTASVTDKCAMQTSTNRTLEPSISPITLPKSSVTDNQVLIQNKTSQTISKSVSECYTSAPPSSKVTCHLLNIPHGTFSSLQTASVTDKCAVQTSTNRTLKPSISPITLPKSSVTDNQVLIQNKTSHTISKSVPEYHSSEMPPSSNVTHHLLNIPHGTFSSLQTASVTDKSAVQTSTNRTLEPSISPITHPKSSVTDNQVLIQNKTSQTISKSVPECYTSAPPSSKVTCHLLNIPHGTFSSLQTASVTDKSAVQTSTNRTLEPSISPITLPKSSVTDNEVLIQNKTSQTISKSVPEYHSSKMPPSSNVTHHLLNIPHGTFSSLQTASVTDKSAVQTSTNRTLEPSISPITLPKSSVTDNEVLIQNKTSQTISKSVSECYTSAPPSSKVTCHLLNIPHGTFSSLQTASVTDKSAVQTSTNQTLEPSISPITLPKSSVTDNQVLIQNKTSQTISKSVSECYTSTPPSSKVTCHLLNIPHGTFSSLQTASVTDESAVQTSTNRTLEPSISPITLPKSSVTDNQVLIQNKTSQAISKSVPEYHSSEIPPSSNVTCHLINITQGAFSSPEMVSVTDKCASELIQMKSMPISQNSSSATSKPVPGFHPSEVLTAPALNVPSVNTRIPEYHSSEIPPSSNVTYHLLNITQGAFSSPHTASVTDKFASTQVLMPISQQTSSATSKRVSGFHPSEALTAPAFNISSGNITHQPVSETLQVITQKSSQFQSGLPTVNVNESLIQTNTTSMPPVTSIPVSQPSQKEPSPSSSVTFKEIKELSKEERTTLPPSEAQRISMTLQEPNIELGSSNFPVPVSESMITDTCVSYEMIMQNKTAKMTTQLPSSLVTFKELCKEERTTLSPSEAQRIKMTLEEMNIKLSSANFPVTTPESMVTDECVSFEMLMQDKTAKMTSRFSTVTSKAISEQKPSKITPVICTTPCQMEVQGNQIPASPPGISKLIGQPNQKMPFRASISNSFTNKISVQNNKESDNDKALVQNSQMPFPATTFKPIQEQKSTPPPVDIPAIYIVTENIFNSIINELVNKNKMTHKGTGNKMLIQNSAVKDPDQHGVLTPTVYIITDKTPRNRNNETVTRNKMKNVVNKILKQPFTSQRASPKSSKPIGKPHLQKISTLLAHGAPPVNIATDGSDEILILSKPAWLGHQILIQNNTAQLPLSRYSVPLQPVQQSHQADILRESSFGAPPANIFETTRKKIPIQNNTTSKSSNLKNGMVVDNVNKWIKKEIMKLKAALPYKSATKENMDITSLPDDVQKCLSKEIVVLKTAHLPSQSSSVVTDFSHLKQESAPDNTLRIKMTGIPYIMRSVVSYPLSPINVTTKKTATVSMKQREHATYYDEEDEEPDELLSGLSVTLEKIETRKGESRSHHSLNPQREIISSPSHITTQSSSPEKFQGMPCHILQLPLHPTAAFPYKENHLPLFYIPHIPFNLLNVATPSSLYANETTPLVLILIPGSMQAEPWMTHQSSSTTINYRTTTEFTKYKNETKQTEASILLSSLLPSSTKSSRCITGTTMNINSKKSHTTERLTKTTPSLKGTLKPGFITNILGSTISLTLHNRTKLTSCPSYLTSKEMHVEALEHSVPGTTLKISLSETSSSKIKLQSKPSTTTHSKYARNKSSTTKTTAKPKKLTTVNINKISSNVDKCISHLSTKGNNVYRSSKPPHSFTEIIYNRLEEDEDEESGSTLISVPLTTAKIMIEPKSHKRVKRTSALTTYYVKSPVKILIMTDDENNLSNAEGIENLINGNAEGEPLGEKLDNFGDLKKKRYFIYLEKDKPNVTLSESSNPLHMCSVDGVVDDFSSYALHDPSHFIQVIENYNCSKYIAVPGQIKLTNEARPRMVRRGGYEAQELSRNSMSVNEADLQSIISTSQVTQTDNQIFMFPGSSAVISCQGSSRKMQPQDTPNTMYRWKREDGQEISGQHSWETAYGELCLNNVGAEDAGKYVCHSSSFNPNSEKEEEHSFTHHISVVLLPKYLHQVMVHYHAEPTCEDIDVDLLKLFLPEIVGEHLCGSRELCRVEVVQPYCYRGMRGEMYLSLTIVIRDAALYSLLPVLNQTFCGMTCKGKADAKFVLLMNQNLAAFFKSPIHSRLSYRSANFTPVESSFSSRMVTGCRAGFQLEQGFCEPCPADWYSEEDSAQCNKCGAGKYQPRPGSSMCLKCPHPFASKKCLSLFHQQYAYMAMALVSLLIVKLLLLYLGIQFCKPFLLWYKRQKERKSIPDEEIQPWVRSRYPESRRSRRREERRLRASRSQLHYYQPLPEEEGGCTCERQSYRRSSKDKIPPKPPPPDFI